jgi:hypothetical protein
MSGVVCFSGETLAIVNSYGDTLPDESVLKYLREWNASRPIIAG